MTVQRVEAQIVAEGGRRVEIYPLPTDEEFLFGFLEDAFRNHWSQIVWGPILEGAAYEIRCPCAPVSISRLDGYLTVHFGGSHFHLCIGEHVGPASDPTPPELAANRRTSRAEMFRRFDRDGHPISWGFRCFNFADRQLQLTLFFPSPFLKDDRIEDEPDWSRLAMWYEFSRRYLGREPDGLDELGQGYRRPQG